MATYHTAMAKPDTHTDHPPASDAQLDAWLAPLTEGRRAEELTLLRQALSFSARAQPEAMASALSVAQILHALHLDHETLATAILRAGYDNADVERITK